MTQVIQNTSVDTKLNISELTEGTLQGNGVFDVLLQTLRLHLDREFKEGRITGTAYATVYSNALTSFLQQAIAYSLSKAKLALELKQLEEQVELTQLEQNKLIADTRQTDYITDVQLVAETALKNKQLDILSYDLTNIKPTELAIAQQEIALKTSQAALLEYDLTTLKPQELAIKQQELAIQTFIAQTKLPAEVSQIQAQTSLIGSQELQVNQETSNLISQQGQIEAETVRTEYQTQYQIPEEIKVIKYNQDKLLAETDRVTTDIAVAIKQGLLVDAQTCDVRAKTNQTNAEVKLKLPEEVELLKRNYAQVSAQTSLLAYDLNNIKPVELSNLGLTGLGISADTENKTQVTANLVLEGVNTTKQGLLIDSQKDIADKQVISTETQTAKMQYEIDFVMPEEVKVIQLNQDQTKAQVTKLSVDTLNSYKQGKLLDAQVCEVETKTNQINTELALRLPEEIEVLKRNQSQITAQTDEIIYRSTTLLPSQTAQNTAQTAQISYTTSTVLPASVANTNAQTNSSNKQADLYQQKIVTEQAQAVTAPASGSAMGMQNLLMERQAENYIRDAEQKAAKIMTETWQVRANADPNAIGNQIGTDNKLTNLDVGAVIGKLKTGIGV